MSIDIADFAGRLNLPEYPRSSAYDADWLIENMMGPNPLWLTEALTDCMPLQRDERVMDLGCGKALSSIFLAKEFGVHVEAVDLWIGAAENRERIRDAHLSGQVDAVQADAVKLPFDDASFDAIASVDAYHYFGTSPEALPVVLRVLRQGGRVGIVVPGLVHEIDSWPEHLMPWWQDGFDTFHSPEWWRCHWEQGGQVKVELADRVPHGHDHWRRWAQIADDWAIAHGQEPYRDEVAMLQADTDRLLGFTRVVATKPWT